MTQFRITGAPYHAGITSRERAILNYMAENKVACAHSQRITARATPRVDGDFLVIFSKVAHDDWGRRTTDDHHVFVSFPGGLAA